MQRDLEAPDREEPHDGERDHEHPYRPPERYSRDMNPRPAAASRSRTRTRTLHPERDHMAQFLTGGEPRMHRQEAQEIGDKDPEQGADHHDAEGRRRRTGRGLVRVAAERQHDSQSGEDGVDAFLEAPARWRADAD